MSAWENMRLPVARLSGNAAIKTASLYSLCSKDLDIFMHVIFLHQSKYLSIRMIAALHYPNMLKMKLLKRLPNN